MSEFFETPEVKTPKVENTGEVAAPGQAEEGNLLLDEAEGAVPGAGHESLEDAMSQANLRSIEKQLTYFEEKPQNHTNPDKMMEMLRRAEEDGHDVTALKERYGDVVKVQASELVDEMKKANDQQQDFWREQMKADGKSAYLDEMLAASKQPQMYYRDLLQSAAYAFFKNFVRAGEELGEDMSGPKKKVVAVLSKGANLEIGRVKKGKTDADAYARSYISEIYLLDKDAGLKLEDKYNKVSEH